MSRTATSRLKVNPALGQRPSLEFRRLNELRIDPAYQRETTAAASQTLIRRIAMFWDWSLCQPLAVAKRADGGLYVVDGQHRLEAAKLRRDIEDLPCVVTPFASAGDEAAAFVALNQQRRPLGKIDLFKAALAADDRDALAVAALLEEAGLKLAPHLNCTTWRPGMISHIGAVQGSYVRLGARPTAAALKALAGGFSGQILQYAGTIFPGVAAFVSAEIKSEGRVELARLIELLGSATQKEWVARIRAEYAATGKRRDLAAKNLLARSFRSVAPGIVSPAPRSPGLHSAPAIPPATMLWCDQCDQRVSGAHVARCTSQFCKAKAVAA